MMRKRILQPRILAFVEGFWLLHRMGPDRDDVLRYFDHHPNDKHILNALFFLVQSGELVAEPKRFRVKTPQRTEVFRVVRVFNFDPDVMDYEQKLEPYRAHSKPMEGRGTT